MSANSPKLSTKGKFELAGESTFGTENDSAYEYVELLDIDVSGLTAEFLEDEFQRQDIYETVLLDGLFRGTFTTTHRMQGPSSSVPSAAYSHNDPSGGSATGIDMVLGALASAFGNIRSGGYEASSIGSSGSPVDTLTATDLSTFVAGQAVAWEVNEELYEVGWLTSITSGTPDEAGLLVTPDVAPTGDALWGSHTLFVKSGSPYHSGTTKSFCARWSGHDSKDRLVMTGIQPLGVNFSWELGAVPTMTVTWGVAAWEHAGTGGAPSVATWTSGPAEPVRSAHIVHGTDGGTRRAIMSLSFDLGLTRAAIKDMNTQNGVGGWVTTDIKPRISYTAYKDYDLDEAIWDARQTLPFVATIGTVPGRMFSLCAAAATHNSQPGRGEDEGLVTSTIELRPCRYTGDTGSESSSVPTNTFCRLAVI